jgi:hypothetical protein
MLVEIVPARTYYIAVPANKRYIYGILDEAPARGR